MISNFEIVPELVDCTHYLGYINTENFGNFRASDQDLKTVLGCLQTQLEKVFKKVIEK